MTWNSGKVKMIDQTALPTRLRYVTYSKPEQVAEAIRTMVVRGAPAIGVAAAMGAALGVVNSKKPSLGELLTELDSTAAMLRSTRPTAVNLFWGIDRLRDKVRTAKSVRDAKELAVEEVKSMEEEDIAANRKLGAIGADLRGSGHAELPEGRSSPRRLPD